MERPNYNLQATNSLQMNQVPNHDKAGLPQGPPSYSFLKQGLTMKRRTCQQKQKPPFAPYLTKTYL